MIQHDLKPLILPGLAAHRATKALEVLRRNNSAAGIVLNYLVENASSDGSIKITQTDISELTNYSRLTIVRAIRYLSDNCYIGITADGRTNVYLINGTLIDLDKSKSRFYYVFGKIL